MRRISRLFSVWALAASLSAALPAGCARTSPAVGTWKMNTGPQTAIVTLREDGTGTAKIAILPEQPVSWTEKEGAVTLQIGATRAANGSGGAQPAAGRSITATLSEDGKTMTVPFGAVTLALEKQAEAK